MTKRLTAVILATWLPLAPLPTLAAGCPPAQYLNRLRIARAQELLRQGRLVQDIAVEVGYSSQPAFTRAFRAATQRSPRDWLARDGRADLR